MERHTYWLTTLLVLVFLTMAIALPVRSFAQQSAEPTQTTEQQLEARLETRRNTYSGEISDATTSQLAQKCTELTVLFADTSADIKQLQATTKGAYATINNGLNDVLKTATTLNLDTTDYKNAFDVLNASINEVYGHFDAYVRALDDGVEISCVDAPEDVYVTLLDARENRAQIVRHSQEARQAFDSQAVPALTSLVGGE